MQGILGQEEKKTKEKKKTQKMTKMGIKSVT